VRENMMHYAGCCALWALEETPAPDTALRTGLVVDVETTGLDPNLDEIIELAMTPFRYGPEDRPARLAQGLEALADAIDDAIGEPENRLASGSAARWPATMEYVGACAGRACGSRLSSL
jgi:hypothetical protein